MPLNFQANVSGQVLWFMFDLTNRQLITSPNVPADITDTKDVLLTEVPIPGQNFSPIQSGGMGNRKVSFTLPLIKRNNTVGNMLLLKQFHSLRNRGDVRPGGRRTQNPRVLYYWGIGSVPQVWYVKRADPTSKQGWVNQFGYPQYSEISMELWLDATHPLTQAEDVFRQSIQALGLAIPAFDVVSNLISGGSPY